MAGIETAAGVGRYIGKKVLFPWGDPRIAEKTDRFRLKVSGIENIQGLKGESYIIAANHVQPHGSGLLEALGLAPDAFILRKIVNGIDQNLRIVAKYDLDEFQAKKIPTPLLKYFEAFQRGLIEAHGDIPVRRKGRFNIAFGRSQRRVIEAGEPILIFPAGEWGQEINGEQEFKQGVAFIAKRFHLPVIPVYIEGCSNWKPIQTVLIAFGSPLTMTTESREEFTDKIKKQILDLKENAVSQTE